MSTADPSQMPPPPGQPDAIRTRLEASRRELLDLTYQNRLLNYRDLAAAGVRVVEERAAAVFDQLCRKRRPMGFDPSPMAPGAAGPDGGDVLESYLSEHRDEQARPWNDPQTQAERLADSRLQTPYSKEALERRLLNTYYRARESIEEQGVNTLFLALGMLHYTDEAKPGAALCAPVILVPVELSRTNVRAAFRVAHNGDELGHNVSLEAKLQELGVAGWPGPLEADDQDEVDLGAYFDRAAACVAACAGWRVERDEIALGFFSFQKFVMYKDLDPRAWPADTPLEAHPVVARLIGDSGFGPEPAVLPPECRLDDVLRPADLFHVVDADSSQAEVLAEAATGRCMVIEGPPGTGKSQTITNLIAQAVAAGKSVLFVAEKLAALEVVQRRLANIGLGDLVLEFHSHKTNKAAFLAELRRMWELGAPRVDGFEANLKRLTACVAALNRHADDVNRPIGESGRSPYHLFGRLPQLERRLAAAAPPALDVPGWLAWTAARAEAVLELARELEVLLREVGIVAEHPFRDARLTVALPGSLPAIAAAAERARAAHGELEAAWRPLAGELGLPGDLGLREAGAVLALLARAESWPDVAGLPLDNRAWDAHGDDILALVGRAEAAHGLVGEWGPHLVDGAWDSPDAEALCACLTSYVGVWHRWFSPAYRAASRKLAAFWRAAPPRGLRERVRGLRAVVDVRCARRALRENEEQLHQLFGPHWKGEDSQADLLRAICAAARELRGGAGRAGVRAALCAAFSAGFGARGAAPRIAAARAAHARCAREVTAVLELLGIPTAPGDPASDVMARPLPAQAALLDGWAREVHRLPAMARLNAMRGQLRDGGLAALADTALAWPGAGAQLAELVEWRWGSALLESFLLACPDLARFSAGLAERAVAAFREADLGLLARNRARVLKAHHDRIPDRAGAGEMAILNREFNKRARLMPIRRLLDEAGRAVQRAKPVFMMSPFSVAAYLPRGSLAFDLVVFDEASQVRPVDALGAVARGRQVVVVGDSRQLPPTAFFEKMIGEEAGDESETRDVESILGQFNSRGAPRSMLRWHYRSRHHSLIDYSNRAFYGERLVVFPSPSDARAQLGVSFVHLPGCTYERGGNRPRNATEAQRVAEEVMRHAAERPGESLGVVAFNVNQMQEISDRVEILRRQRPELERFFDAHADEPFFVKNLESVQGDERDVIFISVGFGRDAQGRLYMAFGALNGEGGERRLNVLVTRAKRSCVVFSSIASDEIIVSPTAKAGVRHLKGFLRYAEEGSAAAAGRCQRVPDSPFEQEVADALTAAGHRVHRRVGSAGCSLDLAVADPATPGRYRLGIECDGPGYHGSRWARDRDRLRPGVLEGLGWTLHRIWSRSWFDDPAGEVRRIEAALARADRGGAGGAGPPPPAGAPAVVREAVAPGRGAPGSTPYVVAALPGAPAGGRDLVDGQQAARLLLAVVKAESPVHIEEAFRRVAEAAGVRRLGQEVRDVLQGALERLVAAGRVSAAEQILWLPGRPEVVVRSRAGVDGVSNRVEHVPYPEVLAAFEAVLKDAFRIGEDDLCREALDRLGLGPLTQPRRQHLLGLIERAAAEGRLGRQGPFVVAA